MTIEQAMAQATAIQNPAWDIIKEVPHDDLMARHRSFSPAFYSLDTEAPAGEQFIGHRDRIASLYAWSIPAPDSLAFIVSILDGRSVVEIGAGSGYWAWLLTQMGVDVNAYDPSPIGHEGSWFGEAMLQKRGFADLDPIEFHPVKVGGIKSVRLRENQGRVLFLSWPTMDSWAAEVVRLFKGDTIIYIGEGPGGCTADSDFFALVGEGCGCWDECDHSEGDAIFERIATGPLTQWSGIHDTLNVYQRKAH